MSTPADKLRALLEGPEFLIMPCCFDPLSARLIEQAGVRNIDLEVGRVQDMAEIYRRAHVTIFCMTADARYIQIRRKNCCVMNSRVKISSRSGTRPGGNSSMASQSLRIADSTPFPWRPRTSRRGKTKTTV